jgi:glycosyltransferase involved in cell wall biosynthesis
LIHSFWADEPGLTAALAGRLLRRPSLATLAGGELVYLGEAGYGNYGSTPRRLLTRLSLAMVKGITTASDYQTALAIERGVALDKLTRVNLGVDIERFRPGSPPDLNRPVLLQAASLVPVKNQDLLLDVLRLVSQTLPEARLLLAGDGPLRSRLASQAQEQDLDGRVVWMGRLAYPEMPSVYHQAHLYVHTSRHESGPMAVVEAMACGLPVIGTPVGLLPEVAAMPASAEASTLAEESIAILRDPERYQALRRQARGRVESAFSLEQTVSSLDGLYERLCQEAGR